MQQHLATLVKTF